MMPTVCQQKLRKPQLEEAAAEVPRPNMQATNQSGQCVGCPHSDFCGNVPD